MTDNGTTNRPPPDPKPEAAGEFRPSRKVTPSDGGKKRRGR